MLSEYFALFYTYFATDYIAYSLFFAIGAIATMFILFRFVSKDSAVRTNLLLGMTGVSACLWIFVLSSLAYCAALIDQYWISAAQTISLVAKLSLLTSLGSTIVLVLFFRARAINNTYRMISTAESFSPPHSPDSFELARSRISGLFARLGRRIEEGNRVSSRVSLTLLRRECELPSSLAFDSRRSKIIGIKENVVEMLDDDELESVIAHELGHINQKDARQKSIATAFRVAFPFDPLAHLVEAAVWRERELAADEFSAELTKKPAFLASALLKIYENDSSSSSSSSISASMHSLFSSPSSSSTLLLSSTLGASEPRRLSSKNHGILGKLKRLNARRAFNKQPQLEVRIKRLLEIDSHQLEPS